MKKFAVVPLVLALSLGAAACSKGEDTTNTAVSNDVTLNSDEVVTDENATATLDANTTEATDLNAAGTEDLGNAGTATTNTL